jgi:phosphate:Na+ symporter
LLRERCLRLGSNLPWPERGAILTLLGSAERAFYQIERIDAERRSVSRTVRDGQAAARTGGRSFAGGAQEVPVPT